MPRGEKNRKLSDTQITNLVTDYLTPLPNGSWVGCKLLQSKYGVTDGAILYHLRKRGVSIRSYKESHAHGKQCKPITNLPPVGENPPSCLCGCGQPVNWYQPSNAWLKYATGCYPPKHLHQNKEWLYHHYVEQRLTLDEVAALSHVTRTAIVQALNKQHITRRTSQEAQEGHNRGSENPAWKGGTTPERQRLYKQGHWREFSLSIYARDNYLCQRCGNGHTAPRTLHCHHLQAWSDNPPLRFEPSNCLTLCNVCHRWVHSKANINREFLK